MAKVTVHRGDAVFEITDLSFDQVKELIGVNGHAPGATKLSIPANEDLPTPIEITARKPDFSAFLNAISDRGRDFVRLLRDHPDGIEANELAGKLGYQDARQIGGLTGGGLAKIAKRHSVRLKDVYRAVISFPDGKRTVTFFPQKLIKNLSAEQQKPAI
jgi:hypothetical protein